LVVLSKVIVPYWKYATALSVLVLKRVVGNPS